MNQYLKLNFKAYGSYMNKHWQTYLKQSRRDAELSTCTWKKRIERQKEKALKASRQSITINVGLQHHICWRPDLTQFRSQHPVLKLDLVDGCIKSKKKESTDINAESFWIRVDNASPAIGITKRREMKGKSFSKLSINVRRRKVSPRHATNKSATANDATR